MAAQPSVQMDAPPRLLTTQEVARHLGIPIQTLYRWRLAGQGPLAVRVGKHLRFTRAAVEAWVNEQTETR